MKDNDIDLNKELEKLYEKLKEAKEHYKDAKSKYNLSIFLIIYYVMIALGFILMPSLIFGCITGSFSFNIVTIIFTIFISVCVIDIGISVLKLVIDYLKDDKEAVDEKAEDVDKLQNQIEKIEELINQKTLPDKEKETTTYLEKNNENIINEEYSKNYDVDLNYNIPNISRKRTKK